MNGPLARSLHPAAWWLWAIGMATAATQTTNPLLLGLILAVVLTVVAARQAPVPWAAGIRVYLVLALAVVTIRVVFRILLGSGDGGTILFALPELPLPEVARGIRIGGPVSAEGLLAATYDGLRLATMLVCIGAANLLADPRRLLKSVPGALYDVGTAVVVALTITPQLVVSVRRVRRAQALRGQTPGRLAAIRRTLMPVLADALDNSLTLAAAMGSRGYGRTPTGSGTGTQSALLLGGLIGICMGLYGLLDSAAPMVLRWPAVGVGAALAGVGLVQSGKRVTRTRYRAERWDLPDLGTVLVGAAAAGGVILAANADPTVLHTATFPMVWPELSMVATLSVLAAALPAVLTPRPASTLDSASDEALSVGPQAQARHRVDASAVSGR